MRVLIDTNILIRLFQSANPSSPVAACAIQQLRKEGFELVIVPQNLYELWVVATRPAAQNAFGMSASDTSIIQDKCMLQFRLLRDERGIFDQWSQIVTASQVVGKSAHDARLVAAMAKRSIPYILSFNYQDFKRYSNVQTFDPSDILAGRLPPINSSL